MDISNIRIVAQWKATCSLSTIWQRWGHAARDRGLQGIVILFAEKEYFDDVREEKRQRQEAWKRKAEKTRTVHTPALKRRLCSSGTITTSQPQDTLDGSLLDVEVSGDEDESDLSGDEGQVTVAGHRVGESEALDGGKGPGKVIGETEWREMMQLASKSDRKHPRARRKRKELDPAMDCLINAHLRAGLHCRRKVFDLHFDNASAGENSFYSHYIQKLITCFSYRH